MKVDWLQSIYSDGSKHFVSNPNPALEELVTISLRVFKIAPVRRVILRCVLNGDEHLIPMHKKKVVGSFDYYECVLKVSQPMINYHFYIAAEEETYYYTQLEVTTYPPTEEHDFRIIAGYECPDWIHSTVFYQIFPDRFHNGNPLNDIRDHEYTFDGHPTIQKSWDEAPGEYTDSFCLDFFGGDLEGVREKISYLKDLGVTAIYMNPIFYAATHHRYDCLDYFMVDPHLGGDQALIDLVTALHKENMKIIIDMSINHTGIAHKWFNKESLFYPKEIGAYNNPAAEERQYYFFDENNHYHSWAGVDTLPTLNYASDALRDIIYRSDGSVIQKWLRPPFYIDGWRLDVANTMARRDTLQMHHTVWPEIRKYIKSINPSAYILGEHWTDDREFLMGNEWDSAMNYYGFGRPVRQFIGELDRFLDIRKEFDFRSTKRKALDLAKMFMQHLARLPHQLAFVQFNLFDSHDIARLHNNTAISFESYRGAVIMLFTFPGTPNIYYGDEIGLAGHTQSIEGCRYPMVWDPTGQNPDFLHLYRTLAHLKTQEDALQTGGFKILYTEGYVISYARFNHQKAYIVICSQEDEPVPFQIPVSIIGVQDQNTCQELFDRQANYVIRDGMLCGMLKAKESLLFKIIL